MHNSMYTVVLLDECIIIKCRIHVKSCILNKILFTRTVLIKRNAEA